MCTALHASENSVCERERALTCRRLETTPQLSYNCRTEDLDCEGRSKANGKQSKRQLNEERLS